MVKYGKERPRVVIINDSRTVRAWLENVLTARLRWDVVGIAGDGDEGLAMIKRLRPDLVTIDLALPYVSGQQLLQELQAFPYLRKVVVSASASSNLAIKARLESLGADAFLCKTDLSRNADDFCRRLAAVMAASKRPRPTLSSAKPADAPVIGYPMPVDEHARLAALAGLGLCNSDSDRSLDLLTEHIAKTTSFPACVITFIDKHSAWVKSGYGFDRGSTPRAQAICSHTICGDDPFIVSDTRTDGRFSKLDAVLGAASVRAYVGYPIVASSGVRLGAICLLDTEPRRVTLKELSNLRSMARIAAALIEHRAVPVRKAA